MARASYIYIAVEVDYDGDRILAAFTVKHECKTWLQNNPRKHLTRSVVRVPDGRVGLGEDRWAEEVFLRE